MLTCVDDPTRPPRRHVITRIVARLVDFARRDATVIALAGLVLSLAAGYYAAGHLSINTDIGHLLSTDLPWRQQEIALNRAFPQNVDSLAVVIDGTTPELADVGAGALADKLRGEPLLFRSVRRPDGGPFFEHNGLLFLSKDALQTMSDQLVEAQPLLGSIAHDPSLRGLFDALTLFVEAAAKGQMKIDKLDPTLVAIDGVMRSVLAGKSEVLSWQRLMTGVTPKARDLRRFVLTQPVLDFTSLEPGGKATAEIRHLARALALDPEHGVRVRITGPVALNDEEFATLREGAARSTILSLVSVCAVLFAALRSVKLVFAIFATLASGLVLTAGFAAIAVGSLNLISVAFAVLFIGLAVDFSIQFSIRYRDQRYRRGDLAAALHGTGESIGASLLLAAGATAIGFFSFLPTEYQGIRELGVIAGVGMIIAIVLNFVLLPALLALLRPAGEPEPVGFRRAAPLDRLLLTQRGWVIGAAALLAAGGLALLPRLSFDFNPLNLKDPNSESVSTLFDMMKDPTTTPYTAEVLAPSLDAAQVLADRLSELPEVAQAVTMASYIPRDQPEKLAIIDDLALLLGPTLTPAETLSPPGDDQVLTAIAACRDALRSVAAAAGPQSVPARLSQALGEAASRGPVIVAPLRHALLGGLVHQLDLLRLLLQAKPVTLDALPEDLRQSWTATDGQARVEIFPRGDARDNTVLKRFVAAVRTIAPDATGTAVTIQESGRTISGAFVEAGVIAVAAITILLGLVLRRWREVLLVIAPLLLAAILTLATAIVIGLPLNYANIIALPLLLGIGVAFDIYFVMNWRGGLTDHLRSSTARAVIFSAFTTMVAFGSLMLSDHPGTAEMGKLLSLSLAWTLFCTLLILPALLGPAPVARRAVDHPGQSRQDELLS
jgi:hypothetical protein